MRKKYEVFVKIHANDFDKLNVYERNELDVFTWGTSLCVSGGKANGTFLIALCEKKSDAVKNISNFKKDYGFATSFKDNQFKISERIFDTF
jgi:hypothetical protein